MSLLFDYTQVFSNDFSTKMHDLVKKWNIGIKNEQYRDNTLSNVKDTLFAINGMLFFMKEC